jgi:hypothetical protein
MLTLKDCFDAKKDADYDDYQNALALYHQSGSRMDSIHLEADRCSNFLPPSSGDTNGGDVATGAGGGSDSGGGGGSGGSGGGGGEFKSKTATATKTSGTSMTAIGSSTKSTSAGSNNSGRSVDVKQSPATDNGVVWLENSLVSVSLNPLPNESYIDYLYRTGVSNTALWRDGDEQIEIDESRIPYPLEAIDSRPACADLNVSERTYYGETMGEFYQRTGIENSCLPDRPNDLNSLEVRIPPPYAAELDAVYFITDSVSAKTASPKAVVEAESGGDNKKQSEQTSQLHTVMRCYCCCCCCCYRTTD